ncbi:MAG: hypothetical protein ACYCPS_06095 [Candidatus Saccharimonadales bacterium]
MEDFSPCESPHCQFATIVEPWWRPSQFAHVVMRQSGSLRVKIRGRDAGLLDPSLHSLYDDLSEGQISPIRCVPILPTPAVKDPRAPDADLVLEEMVYAEKKREKHEKRRKRGQGRI